VPVSTGRSCRPASRVSRAAFSACSTCSRAGAVAPFTIFAARDHALHLASIIMATDDRRQPQLEALKKEGEAGRRKITAVPRYGTLALGLFRLGISVALESQAGLVIIPASCSGDDGDDADHRHDVRDVAREQITSVVWVTDSIIIFCRYAGRSAERHRRPVRTGPHRACTAGCHLRLCHRLCW